MTFTRWAGSGFGILTIGLVAIAASSLAWAESDGPAECERLRHRDMNPDSASSNREGVTVQELEKCLTVQELELYLSRAYQRRVEKELEMERARAARQFCLVSTCEDEERFSKAPCLAGGLERCDQDFEVGPAH